MWWLISKEDIMQHTHTHACMVMLWFVPPTHNSWLTVTQLQDCVSDEFSPIDIEWNVRGSWTLLLLINSRQYLTS